MPRPMPPVSAARFLEPHERRERALEVRFGNAQAVVVDRNLHFLIGCQRDPRAPAVGHGVLDQIAQRALQPIERHG